MNIVQALKFYADPVNYYRGNNHQPLNHAGETRHSPIDFDMGDLARDVLRNIRSCGWFSLVSPSDELLRYKRALEEIHRSCGAVCPEFETCNHAACASSCNAYLIAVAALQPVMVGGAE